MKPESYLRYLETLVVSLMAERPAEADIVDADPEAPPFAKGSRFAPMLVREAIAHERKARKTGLSGYALDRLNKTWKADRVQDIDAADVGRLWQAASQNAADREIWNTYVATMGLPTMEQVAAVS